MRLITLLTAVFIAAAIIALGTAGVRGGDSEDNMTCPEECSVSQENCEISCSRIMGGGAKAGKRRECERGCAEERGNCEYRCLHPTPRPTLKPERFHNKPCSEACVLKKSDCYQDCTKYAGGGAMGEKRASCRQACEETEADCQNWCVSPTPKPTPEPPPYSGLSCPEACGLKLRDCEQSCSKFTGGSAKIQKKRDCISECADENAGCTLGCGEPEE